MNEFIMNPDGPPPVDGFVPVIVEQIGYGTYTAIDPTTNHLGLVPVATQIQVGETGRERMVDNPECYAKIIKYEGEESYVYYIRMNSHGNVSDPRLGGADPGRAD